MEDVSRKQDSKARQAAIAAAARALIAERGFEGLRTRDIAERVGINIATLHYHVPSKQALIRVVAQSMRDEFIDQQVRRPRTGLPPRERLLYEFSDFRQTIAENPALLLVLAELTERARRDPEIAAEIGQMKAYWHGQVEEILAAGAADGSFRPNLDPRAAATIVIGSMIASRRGCDTSLERFDSIVAELLRALENPSLPHREP